jgi:hypothetical protein
MGLTEKLQALFSSHAVALSAEEPKQEETKLATAKLDNGTEIETPAEGFAPGAEVFVKNDQGEQIALPDGAYTLEDGTTFEVQGGVIMEAEAEQPAEEMSEAKEAATVQLSREDVQAMINEAVLALSKELVPVIESTQDTVAKLSAQPAAKVQRVNVEKVELSRAELAAMPLAERVKAMINQYN